MTIPDAQLADTAVPRAPRRISYDLKFRTFVETADDWIVLGMGAVLLMVAVAFPGEGLAPLAHIPGISSEKRVEISDCKGTGRGTETTCQAHGKSGALADLKVAPGYKPATADGREVITVRQSSLAPGLIANTDLKVYLLNLCFSGTAALIALAFLLTRRRKNAAARRELDLIANGCVLEAVYKNHENLAASKHGRKYNYEYTSASGERKTASRTVYSFNCNDTILKKDHAALAEGKPIVLYNPANPGQAALFNVPGYYLIVDGQGTLTCYFSSTAAMYKYIVPASIFLWCCALLWCGYLYVAAWGISY